MSDSLVQLEGTSKSYGPVAVLSEVSFDVLPSEVHVLAGEIVTDYEGRVEVGGKTVRIPSPVEAARNANALILRERSLLVTGAAFCACL